MTTIGSPRPRRPRTSIRVRAALAGGLVLGLGAGLTVASWTDAAYVRSTPLTTSAFVLQTKAGAAAYSDATTITATVSGVFPGPSGMLYLPVLVRTKAGSVAGTVSFSHTASAATGLSPVLRYRVVRSATCNAAAFTGTPAWVVGGTTAFAQVTTAQGPVAGPALAANAGGEAAYCAEFSLPTGLAQAAYQGAASSVALTFTATSS